LIHFYKRDKDGRENTSAESSPSELSGPDIISSY